MFDTETLRRPEDAMRFLFHGILRRLLNQGRISSEQFVTAAIIDDRCLNDGCGKRLPPLANNFDGMCACAEPMGNLAEWAKHANALCMITDLTIDVLRGEVPDETPERADERFLNFVAENPHRCVRCRRTLETEEEEPEHYGSAGEMLFGRAYVSETGDEEMDFKLAMMRSAGYEV
jgi:hypothetical protein